MSPVRPDQRPDLAARLVAMDLLHDMLAGTSSGRLPAAIVGWMREFTGARAAVIVLHSEGEHAVFEISPSRSRGLLRPHELERLCPFCPRGEGEGPPLDVTAWDPDLPWRRILRLELVAAARPVGQILLVDLPDPTRSAEVVETFEPMLPAIGMSLRNALDHQALERAAQELEARVAERTRELEASNRELARFRTVFERADFGVAIIELGGVIRFVNPAFARLHGQTVEDLVGRDQACLRSATQNERLAPLLQELAAGRPVIGLEVEDLRQDGSPVSLLVNISPVRDEAGALMCYGATAMDVSERKALEARVSRAERLESIGRLAGGIAHDFNNMLGAILGHVEFVLGAVTDGAVREDLLEIQKAARRSAELTRQLLAFSRQQVVTPRVLDLNETVSGMLRMLGRLIGEGVELAWTPGEETWHVKVDPAQVDQILVNCCLNARDAMDATGRLRIATGNVTVTADRATVNPDAQPGDYTVLIIEDTGGGMTPEVQAHIFEPFFTTKGPGKGTGLGLATVYGIVRQNGGFIQVHSSPGRGTRLELHLPRADGAPEPQELLEQAPACAVNGEHILVVEDEQDLLKVIERTLRRLGYRVTVAHSPSEASRIFRAAPGDFHLLLTDVIMPERTGKDLWQELRQESPTLRCLFMSGYMSNVIARHGVLEPGVEFLQKPFSAAELAAKVHAVLVRSGP